MNLRALDERELRDALYSRLIARGCSPERSPDGLRRKDTVNANLASSD